MLHVNLAELKLHPMGINAANRLLMAIIGIIANRI